MTAALHLLALNLAAWFLTVALAYAMSKGGSP